MKTEYITMNEPIEILVHFMQQIHNYQYDGSFKKEYIQGTLNHLLERIEKSKYQEEFFRLFREGKDFFDYIEYKDVDLHSTDRRHLTNLEYDIQMEIERHRDEKMECDLIGYVKDTLHDYTYYIRKYYDSGEISRRISEYFEANDIE